MNRFLVAVLALLVVLLSIPLMQQFQHRQGEMTLLTVAEDVEGGGATASVRLEVRPGTGNIYLDSFPLTRLDTQSSTRYANQVACDFLDADCSRFDFFYTIRADSTVVGGPSASAPIAVLTAAVLDRQPVRENAAMTGTINSGGIIGPVGGVPEKLLAARAAGISTVLIPSLTVLNDSRENVSGLDIHRVGTLEKALEAFTGASYERSLPQVEVPRQYDLLMAQVAADICDRNAMLRSLALDYNDTNNYTERIGALPAGREYSRASLCFSSNIELNRLRVDNLSERELAALYDELWDRSLSLDRQVRNVSIETIIDLEVYSIVMERLLEAEEMLADANGTQPDQLAYVQERLISAESWSRFFEMPGSQVQIDTQRLREVCLSKIAEAEERISNSRVYFPALVGTAEDTLEEARGLEDPVLCIFAASKAKAQANLLLNALSITEESLPSLVDVKIDAAERVLRQQQAEGFFPLLGYSYWRYSEDLAAEQPYSALTFAEYAIELSSLDMYFPAEERNGLTLRFNAGLLLFIFGAIFGTALVLLVVQRRR